MDVEVEIWLRPRSAIVIAYVAFRSILTLIEMSAHCTLNCRLYEWS